MRNFDQYKPTDPYPSRNAEAMNVEIFELETTMVGTLKEIKDATEAIKQRYQDEYYSNLKVWNDKRTTLELLFKSDLFKEHGVTDNPKAELLYSKAWDRGHSGGFSEVASVFDDLVELIQ